MKSDGGATNGTIDRFSIGAASGCTNEMFFQPLYLSSSRIVAVRGVLTKNHIAREMFQAIGGRLQEVKLGKIFERGDINVEQSCHCH